MRRDDAPRLVLVVALKLDSAPRALGWQIEQLEGGDGRDGARRRGVSAPRSAEGSLLQQQPRAPLGAPQVSQSSVLAKGKRRLWRLSAT